MTSSGARWWQWLLAGAAFFAIFIIAGRYGRYHVGTFLGLIVPIVAIVGWSVCWVVGFIRLVKWMWSLRNAG
jgi:hypothetical protein